jgi:hypothetical protein
MKAVVNEHTHKQNQYRGHHGGIVMKFRKVADGQSLVVIAEVKKNEAWIISGWPE